MNTKYKISFRALAVASLFAIGIATTIATGGGGGGGSMTPPQQPPPQQPSALDITAANAEDLSSTLIVSLGMSFDVGDFTGSGVTGGMGAPAPKVLQNMLIDDLVPQPSAGKAQKLDSCLNNDGTVDVTANLADPNTLTVGDTINVVFTNCDNGDGYVIDGVIDLTIAAYEGNILTDVFLLEFDVIMTDVSITEGNDTVTADGDFTLTIDTLSFPVIAQTLAGTELTFGSGPEVITLSNFSHYLEVDGGVMPEAVLAVVSGRLDSQLLGGYVDYETPVAVRAVDDEDPYVGEILITGANGSSVRIVINDPSSITLEVETDGDGVVDEFIDTNFAALNGNTSTINTSTAPVIAREVVRAVTGFASVTVSSGGQFNAAAPFGQVRQMAVSGDFGPLIIGCADGGTASVSGSIATAGTYSANDHLNATFNACARGEVLNGELDFMVSSYTQPQPDMYVVSGSAMATNLERTAAGNIFTGSGNFDTSYDFRFTAPGFIYVNSSSTSFTVASDGIDRVLSGASVDTEITLGTPPLNVSRFSSGSMTAPALAGSYAYQSITADMFVLDADIATGPYSGELQVTASDGSTLTIVALDELNVRLDIDYEGDAIVDTIIEKTWAELQ